MFSISHGHVSSFKPHLSCLQLFSTWTRPKYCRLLKTLIHVLNTNSGLVQIQSMCRQKIQCSSNDRLWAWKGGKHCRKGRKSSLPHFLLFSQSFGKPSSSKVGETGDCSRKGQVMCLKFKPKRCAIKLTIALNVIWDFVIHTNSYHPVPSHKTHE